MKHLIFIASAIVLAACNGNNKATLAEVRPIGKIGTNTPTYVFKSSAGGKINYRGSCRSDKRYAHRGVNKIYFTRMKEGIYSDCSLQLIDDSGNSSEILYISTFEIDAPKRLFETHSLIEYRDGSSPEETLLTTRTESFDDYGIVTAYSGETIKKPEWWSGRDTYAYKRQNTYREDGRILSNLEDNDGDGIFEQQKNWEYSPDGSIAQIITRNLPSGEISETETHNYSNAGRNLLIEWHNSNGDLVKTKTYTYDRHGNTLEEADDDYADGIIDWREVSTFDRDNNQISWQKYRRQQDSETLTESCSYRYDYYPRLIKSNCNNSWGASEDIYTYGRSESGSFIKTVSFNNDELSGTDIEYQNQRGETVRAEVGIERELSTIITNDYDELGNISRIVFKDSYSLQTITFQYEY